MPDFYAEAAKLLLPGLLGALGGYGVKIRLEKREENRRDRERWNAQKQSHWSPLLEAAQDLEARGTHLARQLRRCTDPRKCRGDHRCAQDKCAEPVTRESFYRDCCELYMLSRDGITDLQALDPNEPRRNDKAVQDTRRRMCHELTYAVSSLYKTAKYLGVAERVRRDLKGDLLMLDSRDRDEMVALIEGVRQGLQGQGAGIFVEQQESIGEVVWAPAGGIITNFEFRQRLLKTPDWEQFTNLFRFFVDFEQKLDDEVRATLDRLAKLIDGVGHLCSSSSKADYEAGEPVTGTRALLPGLPLGGFAAAPSLGSLKRGAYAAARSCLQFRRKAA